MLQNSRGATRATQFATLFVAAFNYRRKANKRPRCVQQQQPRQKRRQQRHISASLPTWLTVQLCQPPKILVLHKKQKKKTHRKSKNIVENVCSKPWKSMGKLRQARIFRISGKREKIFPEYKKQYQHKWKLAVAVCLCVSERENVCMNVCVWKHKN